MRAKVEAALHDGRGASTVRALEEITAIFPEVQMEIVRAVKSHGYTRTPLWSGMTDRQKLVILVEEVGECARAMTYDEGDRENLRAELIQVATMALAWRASLD